MSSEQSEDSTLPLRSKTVCALCRQRKTRCDRVLPTCGFCAKAKVHCEWLSRPQKRGLRAGYVTELESRIENLEAQLHELKKSTVIPAAQDVDPKSPLVGESRAGHVVPSPSSTISKSLGGANEAISDMMTLPHSYYSALVDLWFKELHPWAPILSRDEIQKGLDALPTPVDHIDDLVLRAVIALKVSYSSQAICFGYHGRRRLSQHLRSLTLSEAMAKPSLSSIQALFIIALLDAGSDNLPSTMNIMSMCRRTGESIGIFRQLLQRIESQSPAQVGPPTKDSFSNENYPIALTWAILATDAVSSLGVAWRDVSAALVDHLSGVAYLSTPDFRDSFRTHIHLCAIGLQPVHEFINARSKGEHKVLDEQTKEITETIYRNLMSYSHGLPLTGYSLLADGAVDFDINHIFTRHLSNATVIMLYQPYILDDDGDILLARERCMESYRQIVDVVRNISDADAEINSPFFVHFIAIAVRFKLIYDCTYGNEDRDPLFDILMHGMNMCGRRFPLARRVDTNFRAAILEARSGVSQGLPEMFWNPKISCMALSEPLKQWSRESRHSVYLEGLNGPYA